MALNIVRRLSTLNVSRQLAPLASVSTPVALKHRQNHPILFVPRPLVDDDICTLKFSRTDKINADSSKDNDKLPGFVLQEAQEVLCKATQEFFVGQHDHSMFHPEMVFENRVTGRVINGYVHYRSYLSLVKMYGHIRYIFVVSQVQSSWRKEEEQSVSIHFKFSGMGIVAMGIKYFPKKLYSVKNMLAESRTWLEAVSTFYIDNNGKIVRHVVDNKNVDHDRTVKSPVDRVKEKLAKMSPNPA